MYFTAIQIFVLVLVLVLGLLALFLTALRSLDDNTNSAAISALDAEQLKEEHARINAIVQPAMKKRWEILTHERADWERQC